MRFGLHGVARGLFDLDECDWGAFARAVGSAARWRARWP